MKTDNIYKTKKIRRGWIVVNKLTGNHAHFRSSYGCRCILIFIREGLEPDSSYLKESYRRLTEDKKKWKEMERTIHKYSKRSEDVNKDSYIIYRCQICGRHFVLFTNEVKHSEEESKYITCSYDGRHKDIIVCGRYESIRECMDHDSYKRVGGKIRQR